MANDFKSLLPPNANEAERALERATTEPVTIIRVPVRDAKNPDKCPVELLPWLAWEFSVDTWNTDWTEGERRAAVKRAAYIHRHRGTRAALETSLSTSPFSSNIVEWFEKTPRGQPYTFSLHVIQDDRPITLNDVQDLKTAVMKGKNLRSWFDVSFFGFMTGKAILAGYMKSAERTLILPAFEIIGAHVNGWMTTVFNPNTSFQGAVYSLLFQGNVGEVVWSVKGAAEIVITDETSVTIKIVNKGKITLTGTDSRARRVTHTLNPHLWFVQDGSKGVWSGFSAWCSSKGGRAPTDNELSYQHIANPLLLQRGNVGALWNEWGDMAVYGWPGSAPPGAMWADWWLTGTVENGNIWYAVVLSGTHNRPGQDYSSNGTSTPVLITNTNQFYRCYIIEV